MFVYLSLSMPFKNREYRLNYRRQWYSKNKKSEIAHVRRRKLEIKEWFKDYKKILSCIKCGENHPATLEFHHKSGLTKDRDVAIMVNDGCSKEKIMNEIRKCQVLCANCHRKIHWRNKNL
jgi:hypothetical protein